MRLLNEFTLVYIYLPLPPLPSLIPATEVTTVFIFHEPSQLTPLQDNGLPGVVLNSIINKQVCIYGHADITDMS